MTQDLSAAIDRVDWNSYAQPVWNEQGDVAKALKGLANAHGDAAAHAAYNRVLTALGNNHAGTYYPVVLPALSLLQAITEQGPTWARVGSLDVLIDLLGSFQPQPGFEVVTSPDGTVIRVAPALRSAARALKPTLMRIHAAADAYERERALARELLEVLERIESSA
jgi:hypothetical protein